VSKALPFMRFWPGDYLKDTSDLSVEEHGAYLLVLLHMWQAGGTLPDDDAKNARRLGVSRRNWLRYKEALSPYLTIYGSEGQRLITQKRLQVEMNIAVENSARQTEKARKAANELWGKRRLLQASNTHAPSMPRAAPHDAIVTNKNKPSSLQVAEERDVTHLLETPLMKARG